MFSFLLLLVEVLVRTVTVSWAFLGRATSRDWSVLSESGRAAVLSWARDWMICEGSRVLWDAWVSQSVGLSLRFVRDRLLVELGGARPMGGGRSKFSMSVVCIRGCACGGGPTRWRSPPVVVEVAGEEV